MKNAFDMCVDIRSLINVPAVKSQITGKIYPDVRPDNSPYYDIVVNSSGILPFTIQVGHANVNIYSPAPKLPTLNGKPSQFPDHLKLSTLAKLIEPYLAYERREDFWVEIESPAEMFQDTDGSWYVNIGVKYNAYNKNYKEN